VSCAARHYSSRAVCRALTECKNQPLLSIPSFSTKHPRTFVVNKEWETNDEPSGAEQLSVRVSRMSRKRSSRCSRSSDTRPPKSIHLSYNTSAAWCLVAEISRVQARKDGQYICCCRVGPAKLSTAPPVAGPGRLNHLGACWLHATAALTGQLEVHGHARPPVNELSRPELNGAPEGVATFRLKGHKTFHRSCRDLLALWPPTKHCGWPADKGCSQT